MFHSFFFFFFVVGFAFFPPFAISSVYISCQFLPWLAPLNFIVFLSYAWFHLSICLSAGILKTQCPSSTLLSQKRPLVSMSLLAAPMMPGTSMMRRERLSSGPPPLHPCHPVCTLRPHIPRYLQDTICITEQILTFYLA